MPKDLDEGTAISGAIVPSLAMSATFITLVIRAFFLGRVERSFADVI